MRISLADAPAWITRLEKSLDHAAERGLVSAAHRLVNVIVTEIIPAEPRVPVDRGIYRGAWRVRPQGRRAVLVANDSPHAVFIEDGVRGQNVKPGRAMIEALAKWAVRKGIAGAGNGRDAKGRYVGATVDSMRIAWAIAKSMQKKGIFDGGKGLKIAAKAARRAPKILEEEVRAEIRKVAEHGGE